MRRLTFPDQQQKESVGVSFRLPAALLAQIDKLANDERRTRGDAIRLLLRGIAGASERSRENEMSEAKYRAYILELSGTVRCLGTFDSEELAQTALYRALCPQVPETKARKFLVGPRGRFSNFFAVARRL